MILEQVRADIAILEGGILFLRSSAADVTSADGELLQGKAREAHLEYAVSQNKRELCRLNAILASKVVPKTYISAVTKQTYHRSAEEEPQKNLPPALFYTFCAKGSRKRTGKGKSFFILEQDDRSPVTQFEIEHRADKKYPAGGFAQRVKKGFVDSNPEPTYAVKILKQNLFKGDSIQELRMAMRASVCARLLGRTGLAFRRNGKQYLVTDWHPGVSLYELHKTDPDSLKNLSIEQRLKLTLDLVRQVAILHEKELIHCDIKPNNIIISDNSIYLIDLDSVRLKGEPPLVILPHTPAFLDSKLNWAVTYDANAFKSFNEKSDLYALGLTLAFIFPDLLNPVYNKRTVKIDALMAVVTFEHSTVQLSRTEASQQHKELVDSIINLTSSNRNLRPVSVALFLEKLVHLYTSQYGQTYNPPVVPVAAELEASGQSLFDSIEAQLEEFNHRADSWKELFEAPLAKPVAQAQLSSEQKEDTEQKEGPPPQQALRLPPELVGDFTPEQYEELSLDLRTFIESRGWLGPNAKKLHDLMTACGITWDQIQGLTKEQLDFLFSHSRYVKDLVDAGILFTELATLELSLLRHFLRHARGLKRLVEKKTISLAELKALEEPLLSQFLENSWDVVRLMGANIPFTELKILDLSFLEFCLENSRELAELVKDVSWSELKITPLSCLALLLENSNLPKIKQLIQAGISGSELSTLEPSRLTEYLDNSWNIDLLVKYNIPWAELRKLKPPLLSLCLKEPFWIIRFIGSGISLAELNTLEPSLLSLVCDNSVNIQQLVQAGISFPELMTVEPPLLLRLCKQPRGCIQTLVEQGVPLSQLILLSVDHFLKLESEEKEESLAHAPEFKAEGVPEIQLDLLPEGAAERNEQVLDNINYSFYFDCLLALGTAAGAMMLVAGIVGSQPALAAVGGLALGGTAYCFFSKKYSGEIPRGIQAEAEGPAV